MKKLNTWYWITTILFGGLMLFSAVPNLITNKDSVDFINGQLGYPIYFIGFIGFAKIAGAVVLFIPGLNRIKEWAYAGLIFDLIAATYSLYAIGTPLALTAPILIWVALGMASYFLHHKRLQATT